MNKHFYYTRHGRHIIRRNFEEYEGFDKYRPKDLFNYEEKKIAIKPTTQILNK